MTLHIFSLLLLGVSLLTSLCTEAIKKILQERNKKYYSNTLAGIVSVVLSAAAMYGYTVLEGIQFDEKMAVYLIALMFLSWLVAMNGYDKVIQTISQLRSKTMS